MEEVSLDEFSHFFLYVGYDTISERLDNVGTAKNSHATTSGSGSGSSKVLYRKFVHVNKDTQWAQRILAAVDKVNRQREVCKQFIPVMESRNMVMLARICTYVGSSIMPPVRRVHGMQRCVITNILMDGCIEVFKAGGRSAADKHQPGGGSMYVGQRFQHFLCMLWVLSRMENIIKHYVHEWLGPHKTKAAGLSMQQVTRSFSNESKSFCASLYKIFVHAVKHVFCSLSTHLNWQADSVQGVHKKRKIQTQQYRMCE